MVKKSIAEIIEALDPETVRTALTQQKQRIKTMIAERVVELQLEENNPTTSEEVKKEVSRALEKQIVGLQEMLETVDTRLADSANILKGMLPRAAKRRLEKETQRHGKARPPTSNATGEEQDGANSSTTAKNGRSNLPVRVKS